MPEVLAGLGVFGLVAVVGLGCLFCLVQPIWSLVDCVDSDRERETKILVSLAIFFTWGLGSAVYGLFFANSANLRRFTIFSSLMLALLTIVSFSSCVSAIVAQSKQAAERHEIEQAEAHVRALAFAPSRVEDDAVAPFTAIHFARTGRHSESTALAEFTLAGPIPSTARDVRGGVRQVAHDAETGRTFALTRHDFGALSPRTGEFITIAVDPSLDFSWPKGVAWDPQTQTAVVMTSHVHTEFFRYAPAVSSWEKLPSSLRDLPVTGLAYVPEQDLFYALGQPRDESELTELQRFNLAGAHLGRLVLSPPIPLAAAADAERGQIQSSSGKLVLVLPAYAIDDPAAPDRIFMVDPTSGRVFAHETMLATADPAID